MTGKRQRTKSPVRTAAIPPVGNPFPPGTGVSNGQWTSSNGVSNSLATVTGEKSSPSGVAEALGNDNVENKKPCNDDNIDKNQPSAIAKEPNPQIKVTVENKLSLDVAIFWNGKKFCDLKSNTVFVLFSYHGHRFDVTGEDSNAKVYSKATEKPLQFVVSKDTTNDFVINEDDVYFSQKRPTDMDDEEAHGNTNDQRNSIVVEETELAEKDSETDITGVNKNSVGDDGGNKSSSAKPDANDEEEEEEEGRDSSEKGDVETKKGPDGNEKAGTNSDDNEAEGVSNDDKERISKRSNESVSRTTKPGDSIGAAGAPAALPMILESKEKVVDCSTTPGDSAAARDTPAGPPKDLESHELQVADRTKKPGGGTSASTVGSQELQVADRTKKPGAGTDAGVGSQEQVADRTTIPGADAASAGVGQPEQAAGRTTNSGAGTGAAAVESQEQVAGLATKPAGGPGAAAVGAPLGAAKILEQVDDTMAEKPSVQLGNPEQGDDSDEEKDENENERKAKLAEALEEAKSVHRRLKKNRGYLKKAKSESRISKWAEMISTDETELARLKARIWDISDIHERLEITKKTIGDVKSELANKNISPEKKTDLEAEKVRLEQQEKALRDEGDVGTKVKGPDAEVPPIDPVPFPNNHPDERGYVFLSVSYLKLQFVAGNNCVKDALAAFADQRHFITKKEFEAYWQNSEKRGRAVPTSRQVINLQMAARVINARKGGVYMLVRVHGKAHGPIHPINSLYDMYTQANGVFVASVQRKETNHDFTYDAARRLLVDGPYGRSWTLPPDMSKGECHEWFRNWGYLKLINAYVVKAKWSAVRNCEVKNFINEE